jgi:hypothetical protein
MPYLLLATGAIFPAIKKLSYCMTKGKVHKDLQAMELILKMVMNTSQNKRKFASKMAS